jgi:hypothetical protein
MLDINAVHEQPTATIDILHPVTQAPLGAQVTLAGPEHPDRKRIQFARQRRASEHSKAAARDLYAKPEMRWLRVQLAAALNDLENFIVTSGSD